MYVLAKQKSNSGMNYRYDISTQGRLPPTKKEMMSVSYGWQIKMMAEHICAQSMGLPEIKTCTVSQPGYWFIVTLSKSVSLSPKFLTCSTEIRIFSNHRNVSELMVCYDGNQQNKELARKKPAMNLPSKFACLLI